MAKKEILTEVGKNLEKRMRAKYRSKLAFATDCDLHEKTIRNVLSGKNVSLKVLKVMCDTLKVEVSQVLKESGF